MRHWVSIVTTALILGTAEGAQAANAGLIKINGVIGPATASYIGRAIDVSASRQDECLIIQLDTPGGLVSSTEVIVQTIYASKVPTVVFVAPPGASATSAGTFITMAADVAAMAPNTRIGAAHPVSMGFGSGGTNDVMGTKAQNDLASFIRSIAEKRGRNANWAESAVRESASITSEKALQLDVIDLLANDVSELLSQLDGWPVNDKTLKTAGANTVEIPMIARERVFQLLWRPEVIYLLMLVALYGIIGELSNPGAIFPGVVGAIALILFLYMATIVPINIAGLALVLLAIALFVADVYASSHGVLTVGGVVSFFLGALMLFNRAGPAFRLSLSVIIPATVVTALFFIFIAGAGLKAQFLPVRAGRETMFGKVVPALCRIDPSGGRVFVEGELWKAVSEVPVEQDQLVEITGIEGLTLKVKPKNQ